MDLGGNTGDRYWGNFGGKKWAISRHIAFVLVGIALGLFIYHRYLLSHLEVAPEEFELAEKVVYPTAVEATNNVATTYPENAEESLYDQRENAIVRAVKNVSPAVVSVSVTQVREYVVVDPFWDFFFPERRKVRQAIKGLGSGFIVDEKGYVWTNEHVVEGADKIVVNLPDGRQFDAKPVGGDSRFDVAVLKIEGDDLPVAELGNSDNVIIGEWAISIGNPFGLILNDNRPTVCVGVISALDRNLSLTGGQVYRGMIQTDAVINQGNSGGPLVNSRGRVIGINSSLFGGSDRTYIGYGFAIPINRAKKVANEILGYGKVRPFWTGLYIQTVDRLIGKALGLKLDEGVLVKEVEKESPASKASFNVGDVIIEVNGERVRDEEEIRGAFAEGFVGDIYTLKVLRGNKEISLKLRLEEPLSSRR